MAQTLLLDVLKWDLALDVHGNIAVASEPYSQAQDAASAIRLFYGELYYDTKKGIPYWTKILGKSPPISLVKAYLVNAALTVPGVVSAKVFIQSWEGRRIVGQVQVTNSSGVTSAAGF